MRRTERGRTNLVLKIILLLLFIWTVITTVKYGWKLSALEQTYDTQSQFIRAGVVDIQDFADKIKNELDDANEETQIKFDQFSGSLVLSKDKDALLENKIGQVKSSVESRMAALEEQIRVLEHSKINRMQDQISDRASALEKQLKEMENNLKAERGEDEKRVAEWEVLVDALRGMVDISVVTVWSKTNQKQRTAAGVLGEVYATVLSRTAGLGDIMLEIVLVSTADDALPSLPPYTLLNGRVIFVQHIISPSSGLPYKPSPSELLHKGGLSAKGRLLMFLPIPLAAHAASSLLPLDKIARYMHENPEVGVLGGRVVDIGNGLGTLYSAGASCALAEDDLVVPFHTLRGAGTHHPLANTRDENVLGVDRNGMVVTRSLFVDIGGLTRNFSEMAKDYRGQVNEDVGLLAALFEDVDLCMRARTRGKGVVYAPDLISVSASITHDAPDQYSIKQLKKKANKLFFSLWADTLRRRVSQALVLPHLRVQWDLYCGCTGVNVEAISYLVALECRVDIGAVAGEGCWCKGFPAHVDEALDRIRQRPIPSPDSNTTLVWVTHKPPDKYPKFPYRGLVTVEQRPHYLIGRSMSESEPISKAWVESCNSMVDEVWVPAPYHIGAFERSGVERSRLVQIPESLDTVLWDPDHTAPLLLDSKKQFKFLSVFKWEERKGWDVLLKAYFEEFTSADDVSLVIHTYLYGDSKPRDRGRLIGKIKEWVGANGMDDRWERGTLPEIVIITDEYPESKMPKLYRACDAFVLPSRGEGWGLPIMEAMAMALPTVSTFWSPTAFMTNTTSYPLDIDGLEPPSKSYSGGGFWGVSDEKWAKPSGTHLRELMRRVFTRRDESRIVGLKAREHILAHFGQRTVADLMLDRLGQIQSSLHRQS